MSWTDERVAELLAVVGNERPVSQETVAKAAEALDVSPRSVSSKLRKMGEEVEKAGPRAKVFSDEEADALAAFLSANEGDYTYAEVAERFAGGKFTAKQVQGKVLSLELTDAVKPTPKAESVKTYTEEQENTFIAMAKAGKNLEEIAETLGKTLASARGKALSLLRSNDIDSIPVQAVKAAKKEDPIDALGDISALTVAEIAEKTGKTERGIRTIITRRGLECADYKAKKKAAAA